MTSRPKSPARIAATALGLVVVASLLAGCTSKPALAPAGPLAMTAFQGEWSSPSLIDASAKHISVVAVDGVNVDPLGRGVVRPNANALKQLARAHANGLKAEYLVGNFDNKAGDFSEKLAWSTLSTTAVADHVVANIATAIKVQGWDGVNIDFESMAGRDAKPLAAFAKKLRTALGPDKSISIAVMLRMSPAAYKQSGYDLPALAKSVDRVVLMAYDQHGTWENNPGPVGALGWQREGLNAMLKAVPADKVELGVAGYGYRWGGGKSGVVSDARARDVVTADGAKAKFDSSVGEWTATLSDGSVLWWSDSRSLALRAKLATEKRLHGLAVWSLGVSDPLG